MLIKLGYRVRDEDGNVLIIVILISLVVGALAALTLTTGRNADWASAKDRNSDIALGVTEAGVHQAIARIEAVARSGAYVSSFSIPDTTTPEGTYHTNVTRTGQQFVIESWGNVGRTNLKRARHLKVTLKPPDLYGDGKYALFSFTSIELKNKDKIYAGDVWANDSITADNGVELTGSMTSAQSWIDFQGDKVGKYLWSGGRNTAGFAINISQARVEQWAKASSSSPGCASEPDKYDIKLGNQAKVVGDATAPVPATISGDVGNQIHDCTPAPAAKPLPEFSFNRANYDDPALDDYTEFASTLAFKASLDADNTREGTFVIQEPAPSQDPNHRIDLSSLKITGNTTIITNAPVFTNQGPDDSGLSTGEQALFQIVSHYDPPQSTSCDINHDNSECAIHFKNQFDPTCKTAVLIYADKGPVGVKNDNNTNDLNDTICGSIVSDAILMKNNQSITYDPRINNAVGFGTPTYDVSQWEELPPS
jgi:hypothetical protein